MTRVNYRIVTAALPWKSAYFWRSQKEKRAEAPVPRSASYCL